MGPALTLPRLVFGPGKLALLADELAMLGVARPLLVSDRGLEAAGVVARVMQAAPAITAQFLDVPENPTAAGVEQAAAAFRENGCDSIIALGGGSVLDTAKLLSAFVTTRLEKAADLITNPALVTSRTRPARLGHAQPVPGAARGAVRSRSDAHFAPPADCGDRRRRAVPLH